MEGDLFDCRVELKPGGRHGTQILDCCPHGECEILNRLRACMVIDGGRHSNGAHVWQMRCRPGCEVGHVQESHIQWLRQGTLAHQCTQRVRVEGAQDIRTFDAPFLPQSGQHGRGRQEGSAGFQGNWDDVRVHACEGLVEIAQAIHHDALATGQLGRSGIVGVESGGSRSVELQLD